MEASQGLWSHRSSVSTGFQVYLSKCWDPYVSSGCTIQLAFFWVFLPCFCMLILSLPLLELGSKCTSLSPGFCVHRKRQYDTICWKLDLISEFFVFSWLIVLGGLKYRVLRDANQLVLNWKRLSYFRPFTHSIIVENTTNSNTISL